MFCLRKKKFWGPSQGSTGAGTGNTGTSSAISNIIAESTGGGAGSGRGSTAHSGASGRGQSGVGTPMAGSSSHIHGPAGLREVTEDTPPDLLEGTMELVVILPSKKSVRMTVSRRTPVMDLLIQVTTANKINPGGHIVQVRNEIGRELQYKPSTPIGALDTRTIEIVPKHQVNEYIIAKSKQSVKAPQPFEVTFRLQVHLPKNQLHVMRVSPRVLLQEVLEEVCREKELDISKYEIRHPVNLDEKLSLTNRLGDYGLQQVRIVSKHSRINSSVSSADILALQLKSNGRGGSQGNLESAFNYSRSSVGESSVSSGSGRGTSPTRSDDSRSISPPIGILPSKIKLKSSVSNASSATSALQTAMLKKSISSNPLPGFSGSRTDLSSKKKRAPPPPVIQHKPLSQSLSQPIILTSPEVMQGVRRVAPSPQTTATSVVVGSSRSRQSSASDSSGYHEASASSILSDQQQEMIRKDRAIAAARKVGTGSLSSLHQPPPATSKSLEMSTSTSNLTSAFSVSTTSISSTGSRTKRKAPKPPATPSLQTPLEEELPALPVSAQHISSPEALERKPVQVQVDVHSSAHGLEETEEEQRSGLSQSSNKSSDTLKFTASAATCSTSMSSSKSGSTLTKSGSSDSRSSTSSRSSIGSLPPSPVPAEEVNRGTSPAMPSNRDVLTPLPPSSPTADGDKHEEASSGSEASYADSGVPATATVTPSPVSLDPDVHEHHSDKSLPSSRRSSIHSSGSDDHSECWRELLETKVAEAELIMMDKTPDFSGRVTQSAPSPTVVQNTNEIHKEAELPLSMELEQNKKEPEIIQVMVHSAPKQDKVPLAPPIEPPKKVVPPKLPDSSASSSEVDEEVATIDGKVKSPAQPIKSQDSPLGPIKSSVEPPAPLVQSSLEPPKKVVPLKLSDSSQPSSEVEDDLITPAVVSNQQRKWSNGSSASTTSKGSLPSKSESFSYKGEFDAKKRRSSVTSAGSTGQRRPASKVIYTSSSEDEELRRSDKKHKSLSMQNLSKKEKGKEGSGAGRGAGLSLSPVQIPLEAEKVVKATSLAALPKMSVGSTEELGSDPKLMETFQVELEQQFEQWKEQFLQRHLGAGQKLSASGDPQREPLQPQKLQKVVGPSREGGSSSSSESSDSEGVVFDPEVPQAVHSVGIGKESVEPPSTFEPPRQSAQASISVSTASDTEIQPINESAMNGVPDVKMREKRAQAAPTVYRYSGPPAINMGTWGERVKRAPIAVKEDNDYIMGMGQNEAKSATVASRIHGFTGVPPVTTFQAKQVQNPAPVPPPVRRSNVEVKPIETGSSASVLATWKQRIDESEKSKTSAEVEVRSVSATNTLERPRSTLNKTAFTISSASNTLERPVSKRTPSPLFANPAPTVAPIAAKPIAAPIAANPFAVPIAAKPIAAPIAANPIAAPIAAKPAVVPKEIVIEVSSKTTAIPVAKETKSEESKISMEEKKRFFQGAKPETAPAPRIQIKTTPYAEAKKISVSAKEPMREDSVDSSRSASSCSSLGSVDSSRPSSVSLEEKKRFFQGIKPAESPTREVPVPAVNMKSSIATIQRVFEQNRNPVYRSISTTSLASDSGSSKVTTPSPSTTPSPYGTLSKHPSDFMVSQVIKGKNFDSVRRTPSPAVPETPKSDVVGSVRISTGANIQTHGNKAIILVGSEVNDSPKNAVGNVYRQHLKINNAGGTEGGATVKISVNGSTPSVKKPSTVVLNGNTAAKVTPPPPPLPKVSNSEIVIEGPKKPGTKSKIQEMQSILAQQKLHFQTPAPPAASKVTSPSVPPAPMLPNGVENGGSKVMKVPTPLSAISKKRNDSISSSSSSSSDGGSSVPATPSSPLEARAGILSAIKNSGGNFALKKTRSSILLN